jgi:hypothetical protein
MFVVGQLVFVKSLSKDNKYLGMIINTILYLNNFEEAFYQIYLIDSREYVSVPSQFIIPATFEDTLDLDLSLFGTGST